METKSDAQGRHSTACLRARYCAGVSI